MMKSKKSCAIAIAVLACLSFVSIACTGCSQQQMHQATINDGRIETHVDVPIGATVGEALSLAEISVGGKDKVTPALDKPFSEGQIVSVKRCASVTVDCDGQKEEREFFGATVSEALEECSIKLGKYDVCNQDLDAWLADGMVVSVERRVKVKLSVDGESDSCVTAAKTVGDLLDGQKVKLGKKDRVKPGRSKKLKNGMEIVVNRVSSKRVTEEEDIPFQTETKSDSSLYEGTSKTKQEGKAGKKRITYEVVLVDGKEESRKKVKEETLSQPQSKIVVQGTKQKAAPKPAAPKASGGGKTVVKKEKGSGCNDEGFWVITYSDGSKSYQKM